MPRAIESPISRMLRFFKDSSREVAEIGLDLATEVVRAKKASVSASAAAASLATALTPAASITSRGIAVPVARLTQARAAAKAAKAKAKGKPGRKPLPEGTLTRAQILQRARDAKKKKAREAARAAAGAVGKKGKAKPAGQAKAKVPPPPGPAAKAKRRKAAPSTRVERRQNPDEGHLPADKLPAQRHPVDAEPELFDNGEDEMLDPIAGEIDPSLALDD